MEACWREVCDESTELYVVVGTPSEALEAACLCEGVQRRVGIVCFGEV